MNQNFKRSQPNYSDRCELIIYALVVTLVFEGILRKFLPSIFNLPIYFFKDLLCIIGVMLVGKIHLPDYIKKFYSHWYTLFLLFIPLFFFTTLKDPLLTIFAAKQYLLYPVVAILIPVAFPSYKAEEFKKFIFCLSVLLIPTTLVAMLQNALPATHWLNESVRGESLEAFSAAGYLRVSSTFSFAGQFAWFLNAEAFILPISFFLMPNFRNYLVNRYISIIYIVLALMLIVGAFVSGGRTAVLGCGATLGVGLLLIGLKMPGWVFSKGIVAVIVFFIGFIVLKSVKPEFFAAYEKRSSGTDEISHSEELENRISYGYWSWNDWFWEQDALPVLFGNGLGVMSNGANQISEYAAKIRSVYWTETDVPTTFWEGGLYLALIWYGFRFLMIFLCFRIWNSLHNGNYLLAASFPMAYIVINGLISQLGMQPPLSIWWWLSIGTMIIISRYDQNKKVQ